MCLVHVSARASVQDVGEHEALERISHALVRWHHVTFVMLHDGRILEQVCDLQAARRVDDLISLADDVQMNAVAMKMITAVHRPPA